MQISSRLKRVRAVGFGLVALFTLSACVSGGGFTMSTRSAPKKVVVSSKSVVVAGPPGFCVDPSATKDAGGDSFVLLGSCASISGSLGKAKPDLPAVLLVSVSGEAPPVSITASLDQLDGFVRSETGRAALSRDGNAKTVEVLETRVRNNMFYVRARDTSSKALPDVVDEYWRAFLDVNGRLVTASVVGLENKPISSASGYSKLVEFTRLIRKENPV